ncbi:MAG: bifunctional DNA primase/polymerase, partial [Roseomonas sp.]|nr:bifunctional DNA primase/polymerase [Roseomonas sp.]
MAFDLVNSALAVAKKWPVFPCSGDKRPLTQGGFKAATRDPAEIRRLFSRLGAALIGVPTGAASGFFVVDCDCKNGAGGLEWAEKNADAITQNGCFIPP